MRVEASLCPGCAATEFCQRAMGLKKTPHLPSSVGHPLPRGEGCSSDSYSTLPGEGCIYLSIPLPWGEGVPQPALSPAGAGRVRGLFVGSAPRALEVRDTCDFDVALDVVAGDFPRFCSLGVSSNPARL